MDAPRRGSPLPAAALVLAALLAAAPPVRAQVVLNEVMYNPEGDDDTAEYVELYNISAFTVDLEGWRLADGAGADSLLPAPDDTAYTLPPGGYALILDPDYWREGDGRYDDRIPPGVLLLTVPDASLGGNGLANAVAETVRLLDAGGVVISSRRYRPGAPQGVSEERIRTDRGEEDDNWAFSAEGGTPGARNGVTPPDYNLALDSLALEPGGLAGAMTLRARVTLHNAGLLTTPPDSLTITLRRHLTGGAVIGGKWPIPVLDPSVEWSLDETLADTCGGGLWAVTAALSAGDDDPSDDTLRTRIALPYPRGTLRLNELMVDPPDGVPVEWMELACRAGEPVPPGGWRVEDASGREAVIDSGAPPLAVEGLLVLADDSTLAAWPGLPPGAFVVPAGWPVLNDGGDVLVLRDPTGTAIDSVIYGPAPGGGSLVRFVENDAPAPEDWIPTPGDTAGTPGGVNPSPTARLEIGQLAFTVDEEEAGGGRRLTLSATVLNTGLAPSDPARLRLSLDRHAAGSPVEAGSWALPALAPGDSALLEEDLGVYAAGRYRALAEVREIWGAVADSLVAWPRVPYARGALRFDEIMPDPPESVPVEWVEIESDAGEPVPLGGWMLRDAAGMVGSIDSGAAAMDSGLVVLAAEDGLLAWPGFDPAALRLPDGWPTLNNAGDTLVLLDPTGAPVDSIIFGAAPEGRSLIRTGWGDTPGPGDWTASPDTLPGTPGEANPWPFPFHLSLAAFDLSPGVEQGEEGAALHLRATVRSEGAESAPPGRFRLTLRRHLAGGAVEAGSWPLSALAPGDSAVIEEDIGPLPGGRYAAEGLVESLDPEALLARAVRYVYLPYAPGALRISELMPDPPESVPVEWVEISGEAGEAVPLGGWTIRDAAGGAARLDSLDAGALEADAVVVLGEDSLLFQWPGIPEETVRIMDHWPRLNNGGDTLVLLDPSGQVVDSVIYGSAPEGVSLVRVRWEGAPQPGDWAATPAEEGGTPGTGGLGEEPRPPAGSGTFVEVSPNPFSPNGDGYEDAVVFRYSFPAEEVVLTLRLFDINGRRLGIPLDRRRLPGRGAWEWDGRSGLGRALRAGAYLWHLEARAVRGAGHWEMKGVLVSAGDARP